MMLEDSQQTVSRVFLNLREVMVGTLFYCKTLEKETERSNVLYICHIIYI